MKLRSAWPTPAASPTPRPVHSPTKAAPAPFLYQKYVGHDNNRDGYMINQIESRMATRVAREREPQILYNHHQSSPFPTRIWIPPFAEPISPHVHPLMWRTVNLIGMSMAQALEERGQKGATHMGTGFDNWYPGFVDHANNFHNVASFLTETGLYRYATPGFYTIQDFPTAHARAASAVALQQPLGGRVVEAASPLGDQVRGAMTGLGGGGGAGGALVAWDAEVDDASPFDSPPGVGFDSHPVAAAIVPPPGRDAGGRALVVDPGQNNAFKALNQAWAGGAQVRFVPGAPGEEGAPGTSGRYTITGLSGNARRDLVSRLHIRATERGSNSDGVRLARPRIGLYRPWSPSMDEGWSRWLLEMYGFDFNSLRNADVLAGGLRDRYDVIIVADMGSGQIVNGFTRGSVPPRYEGGIGARGVRELDAFVRGGGTLVTLNNASMFAIDQLHLPVRNVTADLEPDDYFMSGSIVEIEADPSHPVMSGMPARAKIVVGRSPVFTTEEGFEGAVLARYPEDGSPLLSGYLLGEEPLQGYAAALEVKHGAGRVVLLGMKPQWRGQPFGNFRIFFGAALYGSAVAAATPPNPEFWEAPEEEEEEGGEDGGGRHLSERRGPARSAPRSPSWDGRRERAPRNATIPAPPAVIRGRKPGPVPGRTQEENLGRDE